MVSKVLSSYRFHADKQQHNCSHWGKDWRLGSFFVGYQRSYTNEFSPRRGCYQCPRCKKSGKGVCSFLNVSFWPGDTKLGKEPLALCLADYLFNKMVLVLCSSSHLRLRAGSLPTGRVRPLSPPRDLARDFSWTVFIHFGIEAGGKKGKVEGKREAGKQISSRKAVM